MRMLSAARRAPGAVAKRKAHAMVPPENLKCGDREWVGHGHNGQRQYEDNFLAPFPAVRFRRPGKEFDSVLQKEKGDWKQLTLEDKKKLYRYSYCQTFAEVRAPTGEWKCVLGVTLLICSLAPIFSIFFRFGRRFPTLLSTIDNRRAEGRFQISASHVILF